MFGPAVAFRRGRRLNAKEILRWPQRSQLMNRWAIERNCTEPRSSQWRGPCGFSLFVLREDRKGRHWEPAAVQPRIGYAPALVRTDASHAWIGSYEEIANSEHGILMATSDGGKSWRELAVPCPGFDGNRMSVAASDQVWYFCAGQPSAGWQGKALYVSQDGGENWALVAEGRSHRRSHARIAPSRRPRRD